MKLKNLFFGAVVALVAFACTKQPEIPAGIEVDTTKIEAGVDGKQVEVKVTSSEAWQALIPQAAQDWLHIVPAQGQKGVTTVKVSVDALSGGKGRDSRINFMAGLFTASISVSQAGTEASGDGKTPQTAFSASEAYAWVMANIKENNAASDAPYYVKGFIHKIGKYKEVDQYFTGNSYGNATFYMSDGKEYDPNNEKDFEAYQVNYLGNRKFKEGDVDIKVGDEVIIYGHLTKYNETAETMQQNTGKGAYIYSLNGKVEEVEPPQTEITEATVADFIKSDGTTYYQLTGKVTGFYTGESNGRKYMGFDLTDDTGTIVVYGFKDGQYDIWAEKIKNYGTVVLTGTYQLYSKDGNTKHEVMNTTIISFEEGEAPTEFEDLTIDEFIKKADASTPYRLSGTVTDFNIDDADKKYMKITMKDETGEILVYSFKEGEFDTWSGQISLGGAIVVVGTYKVYQGTPEVVDATIESFEANPDYKYCKVDGSTEIKVAAGATEAELKIQANAAWTITATEGNITPAPASGSADATVKLTFPANESSEAEVVYTLTLKCEAANFEETVTVTQSKAVPAGGSEIEFDIKAIAEANSWANSTKYTSIEKDGVTLSVTKGGNNTGKYYTSGNEWRFYQTENPELTISVAENLSFVSAKLNYNTTNSGVLLAQDGSEVPSGSESSSTVYGVGNNGGANNGQVKFTKIVVVVTPKQ